MPDKELFQIGEVARMYRVSVGTLRHYEQTGLLLPEYTDPQTGYRYYSSRQLEQLTNIRYLRALDLPLDEISAYIHDRNLDHIADALRRQKELITRKKQELDIIEHKIDNRLQQLADARASILDEIEVHQMPPCRMVVLRDEVQFNSYLWLERSIRRLEEGQRLPITFEGKVGVGISTQRLLAGEYDTYDCVFLLLDEEDDYNGRIENISAGSCIAVRFRGSHGEAAPYYERLMEDIHRRRLSVVGFAQEVALIDNSLSNDPCQYVTEIRIPVADK